MNIQLTFATLSIVISLMGATLRALSLVLPVKWKQKLKIFSRGLILISPILLFFGLVFDLAKPWQSSAIFSMLVCVYITTCSLVWAFLNSLEKVGNPPAGSFLYLANICLSLFRLKNVNDLEKWLRKHFSQKHKVNPATQDSTEDPSDWWKKDGSGRGRQDWKPGNN